MNRIIKMVLVTLLCGMIIVWSISIVATKIALVLSFILLFLVGILAVIFKIQTMFNHRKKNKKRFHPEYNL